MEKPVTLGADQLLPFERGESEPVAGGDSLFAELGSHPEFEGDEDPTPDGPTPEEEEGEPEEDEESDDGESEDDEDEEEGAEEPKDQYTVKVDGEEVKVTLDELLQGYSRTADYTRKTTALSEERKTELAALRTAREQYSVLLERLDSIVQEELPPEPNWDQLRDQDPAAYAAQYADYQRAMDRVRAVRAERDRVEGERRNDQVVQWNARLEEERARLYEAVPEWKADPTAARKDTAEVGQYLIEQYGYAPEDLDNVSDHRLMLIFRKAMLYDKQHTKGAEAIREKVKTAPVLKPGTKAAKSVSPGRKKALKRAMAQLDSSGRATDAALVFEQILGD